MEVLVEGVSSASRGPATFGTHPRYMSPRGRARGSMMSTATSYVDWMMAFGALPLGHGHPKIVETVTREIARGSHFATALEVEVEVAEMLVELLPHADKVRFANTGTEAAMAAFRLARGLTGRRKIIKFEGHYHGWWDPVICQHQPLCRPPCSATQDQPHPHRRQRRRAGGDVARHRRRAAGTTSRCWSAPWRPHGARCGLRRYRRHHGQHGRHPARSPATSIAWRSFAASTAALFYLDETVTGFRAGAGRLRRALWPQARISSPMARRLGAGLPMAAITGPDHVMQGLEWGKVLHYGTHNAGPPDAPRHQDHARDDAGGRPGELQADQASRHRRWRTRSASVSKGSQPAQDRRAERQFDVPDLLHRQGRDH